MWILQRFSFCFGGAQIRWGPTYSPLKSLSLNTTWTYFPEGAFTDNIAHSDLDPYNAPKWTINGVWEEMSGKDLKSERNTVCSLCMNSTTLLSLSLIQNRLFCVSASDQVVASAVGYRESIGGGQ